MALITNIKNPKTTPPASINRINKQLVKDCIIDTSLFIKDGDINIEVNDRENWVKLFDSDTNKPHISSFEIDFEKWNKYKLPKHIKFDTDATFTIKYLNLTSKVSNFTFEDISGQRNLLCEMHTHYDGNVLFKDNIFKSLKLHIFCFKRDGETQVQNIYFMVDGDRIKTYSDFINRKLKRYILNGNTFENLSELKLADFAVTIPQSLLSDSKYSSNRYYISDGYRNIKFDRIREMDYPFDEYKLSPVLIEKVTDLFFGKGSTVNFGCNIDIFKWRGRNIKDIYNKLLS